MKKILTAFVLLASFTAGAQTLFTYGGHVVTAADFTRAFKKNNTGPVTQKALKEYLDLYIASRLKIAAAKELGYDTLPQMISDLANLRQQILPTYATDKESVNKLVAEAFSRSQKDIHAAHIFIAFTKNNVFDSAAAKKRLGEVMDALKKGTAFEEVAKQYSDDPSALNNGGDLGWVTVFTLPYELENVVYATKPGMVSSTYQSKAGFHIFKILAERKAAGRIKAAEILFAFPPNTTDDAREAVKKRVDSVYHRLQAGDDFGRLATLFSNDVISGASNGQLPEFGVGDYNSVFENEVYGLQKDGAITKPFLTTHGYHIVQRMKVVPVATKLDAATKELLRNKVEQSDRIESSKTALAKKIVAKKGYKKLVSSDKELWAYSDSVLAYTPSKIKVSITPGTPILKLGDKTATAIDWIGFAQNHRYKTDGSGAKPYGQLWDEFIQSVALQYYNDHLEDFNEEFRHQLTEFADGNLFFEIMQRQVWTPAQTDTVALLNYYTTHKNNYYWKQSADAVIFYAAEEAAAKNYYNQLKTNPENWKQILSAYSEKITADSSRFEVEQLPNATAQSLRPPTVTSPLLNKSDNTASLAYIIKLYPAQQPRSFSDAKGLVINDYQTELEKSWIAELKKKYPVKLNEKVWKDVVAKTK